MVEPLQVRAESTPNPNAMKFSLNRQVTGGAGQTFRSPAEALLSPLARRLFQINGVGTLFFLKDFISVTRAPGADWAVLVPEVEAAMRAYFESEPSSQIPLG